MKTKQNKKINNSNKGLYNMRQVEQAGKQAVGNLRPKASPLLV